MDNGVFRVCADPNNLPFSNHAEQGFENRLASLVAADLGARLDTAGGPAEVVSQGFFGIDVSRRGVVDDLSCAPAAKKIIHRW